MLRVVRGRSQHDVDIGWFRRLAAGYDRIAVDLGTGDGRHVLAVAAARPDTLVVGLDANAAAMAEASRKALKRDALPNALFAVASAEHPPWPLRGLAGELTILFPWASLLRGVLGCDDRVLEGIGRLLAPGAHATALLSVTPRDGDGVPAVPPVRRLRDTYARYGLELADHRPAAAADIAAARSSWAKRLRAGTAARPVTLLRIRRPPEPGPSPGGSPPPSGPGR